MTAKDGLIFRLKFQLWARLKANYPSYYSSHSQFGEDMVARHFLGDTATGFYVDIGAHHPVSYSNTYHFYGKGWRGINVDATPGSMAAFKVLRPRDINLELCLSDAEDAEIDFFIFDQGAYNTFSSDMARQVLEGGQVRLREKKTLRTTTLMRILERHVPKNTAIDLMSIDVEGLDETILRSNDWQRYKPRVLIYEDHETPLDQLTQSSLFQFLAPHGYEAVGKCGPSIILQLAS